MPTSQTDAEHAIPVSEEIVHVDKPTSETDAEHAIPVSEEVVHVDKQERVTGKVRVRTVTEASEELAQASLQEDTVEVNRVPVNRFVDAIPPVRTEGDVVIVPVLEEVLVVEKRLVLKEEVHIRRRTKTEEVELPVTVRRQHAVVERVAAKDPATEPE
jgi:stress response protein YsnF